MKYLVHSFLLLVIATGLHAQSFTLSSTDTISGHGYYHPQIEITHDNYPIALWTNNSSKSIFSAKYNGSSFATPVQLNPTGLQVQAYNWSGADLAIWENNVYIVYRSLGYETGHIYLVKSTDNGATFGDTVRVDQLSVGYGQYPDVAVYNDTVYVTFMDHDENGVDPQYVVSRSVDGGITFENEILSGALIGDEACDCCQPEIVVNDKYLVVFLRNNANNIRDIKGVISYDRGASFSNWFSVDDHQWYINACPSTGPDTRITEDNRLLTTYKTEENNTAQIFLNEYSIDQNLSLSMQQLSSAICLNPNYPQIAYGNNNIGLVWEGLGQSSDVFFNASNSGISGLDTSNTINITDAIGPQSKPDIAYDGSKYHIIYANTSHLEYLQITVPTGISNGNTISRSKIYPNPTKGILTLEGQVGKTKISNVYGNLIGTTYSNKIDISNCANGIYLLKTSDHQGNVNIQKIVKE